MNTGNTVNKINKKRLFEICPSCSSNDLKTSTIYLKDGSLLICNTCGQLVSQCTEIRYNVTMQQFDQTGVTLPTGKSIQRAVRLHGKRLALIRKHLNNCKVESIRLLDVGCSSGAFLLNAKALGFKVEGVEPAVKAAQTARELNLQVHSGYLEAINFPDNSFDCITLFEVIEHLINPSALLKECYRILKPDGIIMISTGNTDSWTVNVLKENWEYFDIDKHGGHISFFNPISIQKIADLNNLKVKYIKTRCVKFYDQEDLSKNNVNNQKLASKMIVNKIIAKIIKLFTEFLNIPSQIFGSGHDMLVVLAKI